MQPFRSRATLKPILGIICACLVAIAVIAGALATQATHAANAQTASPRLTSCQQQPSSQTCDGQGPSGGTDVPTGCWAQQEGPAIATLGPNDPNPATRDVPDSSGHTVLGTLEIWYSTGCKTNWMEFVPNLFLRNICKYNPSTTAASSCQLVMGGSEFDKFGPDGGGNLIEKQPWFNVDPSGDVHTAMIYAPNNFVGGTFQINYPDPQTHQFATSADTLLFQTSQKF